MPRKKPVAKTSAAKKSTKRTPKRAAVAPKRKAATPEDTLWAIIARVRGAAGGELEPAIRAFRAELDKLDDDTLVRVEAAFCAAMRRAYDWNVWGAAYVIHGGCSDDAFWDFRAALIALGRETYEAVLKDPDSLVAIDDVENATLMEGFQYVPGKLLVERGLDSIGSGHGRGAPTGKIWTENLLPQRFPKLKARFD